MPSRLAPGEICATVAQIPCCSNSLRLRSISLRITQLPRNQEIVRFLIGDCRHPRATGYVIT